jgi:hypothetical protein
MVAMTRVPGSSSGACRRVAVDDHEIGMVAGFK